MVVAQQLHLTRIAESRDRALAPSIQWRAARLLTVVGTKIAVRVCDCVSKYLHDQWHKRHYRHLDTDAQVRRTLLGQATGESLSSDRTGSTYTPASAVICFMYGYNTSSLPACVEREFYLWSLAEHSSPGVREPASVAFSFQPTDPAWGSVRYYGCTLVQSPLSGHYYVFPSRRMTFTTHSPSLYA